MAARFGSSGIRGTYPYPIGPDLAMALGMGTSRVARRLLLGHDVRLTSPLLAHAFESGALAGGAEVTFAGACATPSLAYGARGHEAAVVVTASHNPPPDNGFKFWNPDGAAWGPGQETALERALDEAPQRVEWRGLPAATIDADVSRRHAEGILRFAGPVASRVVLDCGSGAGCYVSPTLLAAAGAPVDRLFCEPDGRFPHRPSEPSPENLGALTDRCRSTESWGIAHDGDADRMVAVDPTGRVVPAEVVMVSLALYLGAKRVATPIDASLALQGALPDVALELTRVGDAHVSACVAATGADLGAETSGTYIVPGLHKGPDGPLAGLLFLHAVAEGTVGEAQELLRSTVRRSEKIPLGAVGRTAFDGHLLDVALAAGDRATRVDGLRVDTDQGWFLVRSSGTEPIARITAEAWEASHAASLLDRARTIAKATMRAAAP